MISYKFHIVFVNGIKLCTYIPCGRFCTVFDLELDLDLDLDLNMHHQRNHLPLIAAENMFLEVIHRKVETTSFAFLHWNITLKDLGQNEIVHHFFTSRSGLGLGKKPVLKGMLIIADYNFDKIKNQIQL